MKKRVGLIVLVLLVLVQLCVPIYIIAGNEVVLKTGEKYKFHVTFRDPYDPFRGRYVTVNIDQNEAYTEDTTISYGDKVYIVLSRDEQGFAKFVQAYKTVPNIFDLQKRDYFKATAISPVYDKKVSIEVPFDKYYMEENAAPEAEKLVLKGIRDKKVYISVKVKDGSAALERLYIGDKTIEELLK